MEQATADGERNRRSAQRQLHRELQSAPLPCPAGVAELAVRTPGPGCRRSMTDRLLHGSRKDGAGYCTCATFPPYPAEGASPVSPTESSCSRLTNKFPCTRGV